MLPTGEIHLWRIDLLADARQQDHYRNTLDMAERGRAERAATEALRRRHIVAQGALRAVLAHYLGALPSAIRFERGSHGKPRLAEIPPDRGLVFNLSHSGDQALIAVGRDLALGVDLELRRPLRHMDGMASRVLAPSERDHWQALPETRRVGTFFDFWTAKEAFVKAVGRGLGLGLAGCVVDGGDEPRLVTVPEGCGRPEDWSLWRPNLGEALSAALCAGTRRAEVRMLEFQHA